MSSPRVMRGRLPSVRRYAKVGRGREDRPVSEGSKDNGSMREREREREREIGLRPASHKFPATATNGIPAAHETRRCPLYSSFPCPSDTTFVDACEECVSSDATPTYLSGGWAGGGYFMPLVTAGAGFGLGPDQRPSGSKIFIKRKEGVPISF
jgi:hypothetical protein